MQSSELQQRYSRIEQCISDAAQACQQSASAPQDLKDSLQQLQDRKSEVRQLIQGQDEDLIRDAVYEMEDLGDQARDACKQSGSIDPNLKQVVQQMHDELSSLKHQMG